MPSKIEHFECKVFDLPVASGTCQIGVQIGKTESRICLRGVEKNTLEEGRDKLGMLFGFKVSWWKGFHEVLECRSGYVTKKKPVTKAGVKKIELIGKVCMSGLKEAEWQMPEFVDIGNGLKIPGSFCYKPIGCSGSDTHITCKRKYQKRVDFANLINYTKMVLGLSMEEMLVHNYQYARRFGLVMMNCFNDYGEVRGLEVWNRFVEESLKDCLREKIVAQKRIDERPLPWIETQ